MSSGTRRAEIAPITLLAAGVPGAAGAIWLPKRTKSYDDFEVVVLILKELTAKIYPRGV